MSRRLNAYSPTSPNIRSPLLEAPAGRPWLVSGHPFFACFKDKDFSSYVILFNARINNCPLSADAFIQEDSNYKIEIAFDLSRTSSEGDIKVFAYLFSAEDRRQELNLSQVNT